MHGGGGKKPDSGGGSGGHSGVKKFFLFVLVAGEIAMISCLLAPNYGIPCAHQRMPCCQALAFDGRPTVATVHCSKLPIPNLQILQASWWWWRAWCGRTAWATRPRTGSWMSWRPCWLGEQFCACSVAFGRWGAMALFWQGPLLVTLLLLGACGGWRVRVETAGFPPSPWRQQQARCLSVYLAHNTWDAHVTALS